MEMYMICCYKVMIGYWDAHIYLYYVTLYTKMYTFRHILHVTEYKEAATSSQVVLEC